MLCLPPCPSSSSSFFKGTEAAEKAGSEGNQSFIFHPMESGKIEETQGLASPKNLERGLGMS